MRKILADAFASSTQAWQLKSGSFDHLRSSNSDDRAALLLSLFPTATLTGKAYALSGCGATGTTYAGGWAFAPNAVGLVGGSFEPYEIFQVAGGTFSGTPLVYMLLSYFGAANADPVALNTGGFQSIHAIYSMQIANNTYTPPAGTSVVNSFPYTDFIFLNTYSWINLSSLAYQNNWIDSYGQVGIPAFIKENTLLNGQLGRVSFRGGVSSTSLTSDNPINTTQMPVGYRPEIDMYFRCAWMTNDPTSPPVHETGSGIVRIGADGMIMYYDTTGSPASGDTLNLNNISYVAFS